MFIMSYTTISNFRKQAKASKTYDDEIFNVNSQKVVNADEKKNYFHQSSFILIVIYHIRSTYLETNFSNQIYEVHTILSHVTFCKGSFTSKIIFFLMN